MTTEASAGSVLLKTDTRGLVRTSREHCQALLAEFGRSGLSAMKFSREVGMRYALL